MADNNDEIKKRTKETSEIVGDAFRRISENIKDIFEEALDGSDNFAKTLQKDITRSLNQIARSSSKLLTENEEKLAKGNLTRAQIDKQILGLNSKLKALEIEKNIAIRNNLADEIEINKQYENAIEYNKELIKSLEDQQKESDVINKKLGVTGSVIAGLSKIPVLGNLIESQGVLSKVQQEAARDGSTALSVMKTGIVGLGSALKAIPILAIIDAIISAVKFMIDLMFGADEQVTNLAKSLNITKDNARGVRDRFYEISENAGKLATIQEGNLITQKDLVEANIKINELLGVAVDLSSDLGIQGEKLVTQFANTSKFLKLSNEESKGLLSTTLVTGREVDDIKFSILGTTRLYKAQNGVLLDERKVLQSVLTASNAIKLSIRGGVEGLTKASIEATKLGLDLNKVSSLSEKLLDFESSIQNELEAELITGKQINLETARLAALNGDLETFAKEINAQIGSSADFTRMNVIQQEALAKSVGMTREELADTLTTQESLNKLKGRFNVLGKETIENLKTSGKIDEATYQNLISGKAASTDYYDALQQAGMAQKDIVTLLGQEAAANLEAQSAQDKFNGALEKAKEAFTRFVDGEYLDKLTNSLAEFVKVWNEEGLLSALFSGGDMTKTIVTSTTGVTSEGYDKYMKSISPEESTSKKSFATGGIVTKRIDNATVGEAGPEAIIPLSNLMEEFRSMREILSQIRDKEGTVNMDTTKVGTTTNMGTYKVQ